jgi:hypothetical protein
MNAIVSWVSDSLFPSPARAEGTSKKAKETAPAKFNSLSLMKDSVTIHSKSKKGMSNQKIALISGGATVAGIVITGLTLSTIPVTIPAIALASIGVLAGLGLTIIGGRICLEYSSISIRDALCKIEQAHTMKALLSKEKDKHSPKLAHKA